MVRISYTWVTTIFIFHDDRAAAHVFQKPLTPDSSSEPVDAQIMNSTVATYLGLDKREGLVSIGRRLLKGTPILQTVQLSPVNLR